MSVETVSLGCRLNFAEAETIARTAPNGEDWVIVNSCAVTNEAVRQTRQAIRRAHRRRPDARILVTGCAAELDRRSFEQMPEVARVAGRRVMVGVSMASGCHGDVPRRVLAQPASFFLISVDTRPMSAWPARRGFSTPISLPMSAGPDAPVSPMAASMAARISASPSLAGR